MRLAALLALVGRAAGCIAARSPEIFHTPDRLDRWARVAAIPPGAEVRVWRRGSENAEDGRFVRADDEEMVLEADDGTAGFYLRPQVTRGSVVSGRPYRRYLGNGLRSGLLLGAVIAGIGLVAAGEDLGGGEAFAGIVVGSSIWGTAAIGAIAAGIAPGTTVVFEAPDDGAPSAETARRR